MGPPYAGVNYSMKTGEWGIKISSFPGQMRENEQKNEKILFIIINNIFQIRNKKKQSFWNIQRNKPGAGNAIDRAGEGC